MATIEGMATTPCNHPSQGNGKLRAPSTDPNATNHSPANAADSVVDRDSANINDTSIASGTETSTALTLPANIMPGRSLTFAESLLRAGQISRDNFDILTAHIKNDMNAIGREQPLTFDFAGNVKISHSLKHREVEAVGTVFNIAELLEAILLLLPFEDLLLRVPRVCKGFQNAIESSRKLLVKTWRLAVPHAGESFTEFTFFPLEVADLHFESGTRDLIMWTWLKREGATFYNRYVGLRGRQISCPAVKSMTVNANFLTDDIEETDDVENYGPYYRIMRKSSGITFGDVFDVLEHMKWHVHGFSFDLDPDVNLGRKLST